MDTNVTENAQDTTPKDVAAEPVNPYADRIFKLPEPDAKEGYKPRKRVIVLYPDARLDRSSPPVGAGLGYGFNDPELKDLAADLVATATAADAAGLSAVQVSEHVRMCVVRISKKAEFVVLVNPVVTPHAHTKMKYVEEGCLSFPGVREHVERYAHVNVKYQDLDGAHHQMALTVDDPATYTAAQAVQHEVEHLDGKLLMANLNIIHRDRVRTQMKQVHRKLDAIMKMSRGQYVATQVLFGYVPDPEPKASVSLQAAEAGIRSPLTVEPATEA